MILNIPDKIPIENFVIKNNIIKSVEPELPHSYQIGELIINTFDSNPNHVSQIQIETGKETTFREMKDNTVRCAIWLKKQGIVSGDIITTCSGNHSNAYIPMLATFCVGATFNAWINRTSLKDLQHSMRTIHPKIIFVSEDVAELVVEAAKAENYNGKIIALGNYSHLKALNVLLQQQSEYEISNFRPQKINNPDSVSHILMSSGSTGFPKGVMYSYKNIVKQISLALPYSIKGVVLWYSPFYWITGFMYFMQILLNQGTRIMHQQFDPEGICKAIEQYKIEHIMLGATLLINLSKSNILQNYKLKSLKLIVVAGANPSKAVLECIRKSLPHVAVYQALGTTESGRCILSQTEKSKKIDSLGFASPYYELKVCDLETKEALGPNRSGELCLKSDIMMKGYYNNEEATLASFDNDGWFHTGDMVYYDENGEFFMTDRLKDVMKYQNYSVSPSEIEGVLLSHPGVAEVVVVSIPHEVDGDHAMAFVRKRPDSHVTEEELVQLSESLGEIKKLHGGVKFIESIPTMPNGKIARQILKEWARALA